ACLEGRCSIQLSYATLQEFRLILNVCRSGHALRRDHLRSVGVAGFEPATSASQTRRDNRATLHPELVIKYCGETGTRTPATVSRRQISNLLHYHSGTSPEFIKERSFNADANVSFHYKEHNIFSDFLFSKCYSGYSILKWKMLANLLFNTFLMDSISLNVILAFKNCPVSICLLMMDSTN